MGETAGRDAAAHDYDVVVVGSGFGGSVSALRLVEKGYRVLVLEAGRRFADEDFARTSWDVRRYLFAPAAGCYGILRMTLLRNVFVLSGAGVGGGSLGYANTLYTPPDAFYRDPQWADVTDWKDELAPHYATASAMLGVATNPRETPSDRVLKEVADDLGVGHTYRPTPVGVFFGPPGGTPGATVPDPYFGGAGPARTACTHCGGCMVGCRVGAKNTLVKNYLYLAERAGAEVRPLTTVVRVRPLGAAPARGAAGWAVETVPTDARAPWRRRRTTVTARHVVLAASALGTQRLLHAMRDEGTLPHLSRGSASSAGPTRRRSSGRAPPGGTSTSPRASPSPPRSTPTRSPTSSPSATAPAATCSACCRRCSSTAPPTGPDGAPAGPRRRRWAAAPREAWRIRRHLPRVLLPRRWSNEVVVLLAMQSLDNSVTAYTKRNRFGRRALTSKQGVGAPNPTWIPVAHDVARRIAEKIDGVPLGSVPDLFDVPVTGHFFGGCPIGASAERGVVDPWHRVHGYTGLSVVDGSTVSANLGVNPSLTITALAERAMSFWPNAGDPDPRPAEGSAYRRVPPVAARRPVLAADPGGVPA